MMIAETFFYFKKHKVAGNIFYFNQFIFLFILYFNIYKENQAIQKQRFQDQTFQQRKSAWVNPNVDSFPNFS